MKALLRNSYPVEVFVSNMVPSPMEKGPTVDSDRLVSEQHQAVSLALSAVLGFYISEAFLSLSASVCCG